MATYKTREEIELGRKYHPGFLILKAGDTIEKGVVSAIKKVQGNSATSSVKITDVDGNVTLNVFESNCICGPFGLSNGHVNADSKIFECVSGEVIVYFLF